MTSALTAANTSLNAATGLTFRVSFFPMSACVDMYTNCCSLINNCVCV